MSMKEAVKKAFDNYATFSGRARRSEYWYFILFNFIVGCALGVLQAIIDPGSGSGSSGVGLLNVLYSLYSLAVLVPTLALSWRRLHDIGKSGACFFLGLIPLVGAIILLVWYCKDSQPGENIYGPNPKEQTAAYTM